MNFTGEDSLTEHEKLMVHELVDHCTENSTHHTDYCFEQTYRLGEVVFLLGTKLFYSSLFNNPAEVRWIADKIVELPDIYKIRAILHLGYSISVLYEHMIKNDPGLDEYLKNSYRKWAHELANEKEELK